MSVVLQYVSSIAGRLFTLTITVTGKNAVEAVMAMACPKIGKGRAVAIRQTNTRHRQTNTTTQHNTRYELLTIRTNSNRQRHYSS